MPLHVIDTHDSQQVVRAFFDAGAVGFKKGKAIRFKHGVLSPGAYINNRTLPSYPDEWGIIIDALLGDVIAGAWDGVEGIASVATGGVPHGIALARDMDLPHFIVKKQEKDHGLGGLIDGDEKLLSGMNVCMVEDMSSTFESTLKAMKPVEAAGGRVLRTFLLNTWNLPDFKRNIEHHDVWALCTGKMLLDCAVDMGKIDAGYEKVLRHWLEHPEDESWAKTGWDIPEGATD